MNDSHLPDCWIRAKRKPSGSEQHVVNVSVGDEYREQTFAIEPENVIEASQIEALRKLLDRFIWDEENRVWRADITLSCDELRRLIGEKTLAASEQL